MDTVYILLFTLEKLYDLKYLFLEAKDFNR